MINVEHSRSVTWMCWIKELIWNCRSELCMDLYTSLFSLSTVHLPLHVILERVRMEGLQWVSFKFLSAEAGECEIANSLKFEAVAR